MPPIAQRDLTSSCPQTTAQALIGQPIGPRRVALSRAAIAACERLDASVVAASAALRSVKNDIDLKTATLAVAGALDLNVPTTVAPVRFAAKPPLDRAIADRAKTPSCAPLSAAIASRSLTPWHLRQAHVAATGMRLLPFRTGTHHLAQDADGIAVVFPVADCARVLAQLCAWLNAGPALPPAAQALIAYLQIVKLHAFHDGNGRLARLLLTAILDARLLGGHGVFLPLAAVTFANAEFLSAHYRRAADASALDEFVLYAAALVERALQAVNAVLQQQSKEE